MKGGADRWLRRRLGGSRHTDTHDDGAWESRPQPGGTSCHVVQLIGEILDSHWTAGTSRLALHAGPVLSPPHTTSSTAKMAVLRPLADLDLGEAVLELELELEKLHSWVPIELGQIQHVAAGQLEPEVGLHVDRERHGVIP